MNDRNSDNDSNAKHNIKIHEDEVIVDIEAISKRIILDKHILKLIKLLAIEKELDEDGKITPKVLGDAILYRFLNNNQTFDKNIVKINKDEVIANKEPISKRIILDKQILKLIKLLAIEKELDEDGKITPKVLGDAIKYKFLGYC